MPLTQMICVRNAKPAELPVIRVIVEEAFATLRSIYLPSRDAVSTLDRNYGNSQQLLAFSGDAAIGAASLTITDGSIVVSQLAVLPSHRRQGVARRLLSHAERIARDSGIPTISLNTIMETGNVQIFEHIVFSVTETFVADWCISPDGNELTDVTMTRKL